MNFTRRRAARLVAAGLSLSLVVAACGDDDDDADAPAATEAPADTEAPAPTEAPATTDASADTTDPAGAPPAGSPIPGGTADAAFCEAFVGIERGFAGVPEDPAEIETYANENIVPNAEALRATTPEDLAEPVGVMLDAVDTVLSTGDFTAFETPEFSAAASTVYPALDGACGIPNIEVTAVDYAFGGMPATTDAGLYTILFTNDSAGGEAHEMAMFKLKDGVDMPVSELLALSEEEAGQYIDTFGAGSFAPPGGVSGSLVDLSPGRWVYACFIPVGTTMEEEGEGPPHFMEGMSGEIIVT